MEKNSDVFFIFKRTFLGVFAFVIFSPLIATYLWLDSLPSEVISSYDLSFKNKYVITAIIFYAVICIIYTFTTRHIKFTERIIRLMSEKDGTKMSPKRSMLLSKKIFRTTVKFSLIVFIRYYWLISIVFISAFYVVFSTLFKFAFYETVILSQVYMAFIIWGLVILLGWIYMHFFLAAKTRFVWFTFMTHFGENISNQVIFKEVKILNDANKKDDKEAILGYLKKEMLADGLSISATSAIESVSSDSFARDVARGYARGLSLDNADHSKIKLNFEQYKVAYNMINSKKPELNPNLLSL